jgi:hypothetical protein
MTTAQQVNANRRNATRSTGPRSTDGKSRSAGNSRRHGLSIPVHTDPLLRDKAETLAHVLAGEAASPARLDAARRVAEAAVDLGRIRTLRLELLRAAIENERWQPSEKLIRFFKFVARWFVKGDEVLDGIDEEFADWILLHPLSEPDRAAGAMRELAGKLQRLERYERRAFSRRNRAMRALAETEGV